MYICIYIYICIDTYIYIYIYIHTPSILNRNSTQATNSLVVAEDLRKLVIS